MQTLTTGHWWGGEEAEMGEEQVARGPASRGEASPALLHALGERYGLTGESAKDLGGSSNLNLLVAGGGQERYVVRVYRPWVTPERLADMQLVRWRLAEGGVPAALPVPTVDGEQWIVVDGRLVEVEPYVEHDAKMDTWERIEAALPLLGRIHTLLQPLQLSIEGRNPPASNNIEPRDALPGTLRGIAQIRQWSNASQIELELAGASEELARLVDRAQQGFEELPRQLVH